MNEKRCQKFTPLKYVEKLLVDVEYSGEQILKKYFLENSCGPGNVLCEAVEKYIIECQKKNYKKYEIEEDLAKYFIGFEIDEDVAKLCRENLNDVLKRYGLNLIKWNIIEEDYLKYSLTMKADYIVGNPPYIRYQELLEHEREFLKYNFLSCSSGKFDYCYAFIEKSINDLSYIGKMSYLIPSSIFKNTFANNIREFMKPNLSRITDFKYTQVFSDALTSPAIIFFDKSDTKEYIEYIDYDMEESRHIRKEFLINKWIFSKNNHLFVNLLDKNIETFGDYFKVANSVATLKNDVYILRDYNVDLQKTHLYLGDMYIEIEATRPAASPRGIALNREEVIIFPYFYKNKKLVRYSELEFSQLFPGAYSYLSGHKETLNQRKFDGSWFEYGRSQALSDINQPKLIISSIITEKLNVKKLSKETVPYSGFYIIPKKNLSLKEAKKILESEDFLQYIHTIAINANGKSVRTSVKDIMNYPLSF